MEQIIKYLFQGCIAICLVPILVACHNPTVDRGYLNENGKYAIGRYLGRTVNDSITESVFYEFQVSGDTFQQFDMECFKDSEKAWDHFYFSKYPLLKGNLFVILYDSLNPANSIIRLDYPLRDSNDFKSSITKINQERVKEADSLP